MSQAVSAIDLAISGVLELDGSLLGRDATTAEILLPVAFTDGVVTEFRLSLRAEGEQLTVKESQPEHLPVFCPNRHINRDSSFCVSWWSKFPLHVRDADSATAWWQAVYKFLQDQRRAARQRVWPTKSDWAHGDAANGQLRAEAAAENLGEKFLEDLRNGRLSVRKKGKFYQLRRKRKRLYSVWIEFQRVATLGQLCFCQRRASRRVTLRECGDHANSAVDLVIGIVERAKGEQSFWVSLSGQPCCGTMDHCPLASVLEECNK